MKFIFMTLSCMGEKQKIFWTLIGWKVISRFSEWYENKHHSLYFDNHFASMELKKCKTNACGIVIATPKNLISCSITTNVILVLRTREWLSWSGKISDPDTYGYTERNGQKRLIEQCFMSRSSQWLIDRLVDWGVVNAFMYRLYRLKGMLKIKLNDFRKGLWGGLLPKKNLTWSKMRTK